MGPCPCRIAIDPTSLCLDASTYVLEPKLTTYNDRRK
jgi:hypothetical protein